MKKLSHINESGKANMVDVSNKPHQIRIAKAKGKIFLHETTIQLVLENKLKKGDVLSIAEFAAIQASKETARLIPLCHPLQLTKIDANASVEKDGIVIECTVKCIGQTGVEMEALTAVSVGLLTVYDMCKAVDKTMHIGEINLIEKTKHDI